MDNQPDEYRNQYPTEDEVVLLEDYYNWSENFYAAVFMEPTPEMVQEFREFRKQRPQPSSDKEPLQEHEMKFLQEYYEQELEDWSS